MIARRVGLVLGGLALGAAAAWWLLGRDPQEPVDSEYFWAPVERRDLAASVAATGKVTPMVGAEVRVGSRISGRVERLLANIGDVVRTGQVIAELEKSDLLAQLEQRHTEVEIAEARLSSVTALGPKEILKAEASLADAEANSELAEIEFARQSALSSDGLVPRQAVDGARREKEVTEARLALARRELELARERFREDAKSARAQVNQARAAVRVIEAQLAYATIHAPISGVIGSVSTQEGETVSAGLNSPTFVTIVDLGRLQVDAFVDETDIGRIRVGQRATFTVDSYPDDDFHGAVTAIYPKAVIVDNVVYYDVVLSIREHLTGRLRPEMTTNVSIELEARRGVLTVPARAVTRERGESVVYLSRNGEAAPQAVKLGWRDSQWVEITEGLQEGDRVRMRKPDRGNGGS